MKLRKWIFTEYSTTRKSYNLLLANLQWRLFKNAKLFSYPPKLTICPGNVCNLSCPLCPTGQHDSKRKQGLMDFELFKRIMNECGPYVYDLSLFNWGEPLLNKYIFKMVRYAKKFRARVKISTNLKHFNNSISAAFIQSGLDEVIVSLDGASQESVAKYQIGNDFDGIIANMSQLVALKKQQKSNKPLIHWRFLVNRFNEHELEKARRLSKEIGIDVIKFNKFRCDMGDELLLDNREQYSNVSSWLPRDEKYSMYDYDREEKKKIKINHCKWLWYECSINWNGNVSPCCAVWNERFDFGNLGDSSFTQIWNSPKYVEARRIVRGDAIESPDNICSVCHSNRAAI